MTRATFTIAKNSLTQRRLVLQRVASQTTMAFSHCYGSLESLLKAKWQRMRRPKTPTISTHVYEIRPRADHHGVDLISDALRFGSLWYAGPKAISNAVDYAKFYSRSHDAMIRVYDEAGKVIGFSKCKMPHHESVVFLNASRQRTICLRSTYSLLPSRVSQSRSDSPER
jgi:hypothetical protein